MTQRGATSTRSSAHRTVILAGCGAVVIVVALVVLIIGHGQRDEATPQETAAQPPAAGFSPASNGPYIPPGASLTGSTPSPAAGPSTAAEWAPATGNQGSVSNPADVGAPTNITRIAQVNGRFPYSLATINRASPEQVAWAYTTLRYTVTWTDADSQQATTRAAAYTAPTVPITSGMTPPTEWQAAADAQWHQAVQAHVLCTVEITDLTVQSGAATPGGFTLVTVSWVTTTSRTDRPTNTVPGTNTLNLAAQPDGTWLVANTGADGPG